MHQVLVTLPAGLDADADLFYAAALAASDAELIFLVFEKL